MYPGSMHKTKGIIYVSFFCSKLTLNVYMNTIVEAAAGLGWTRASRWPGLREGGKETDGQEFSFRKSVQIRHSKWTFAAC